jgi:hypothetical protein
MNSLCARNLSCLMAVSAGVLALWTPSATAGEETGPGRVFPWQTWWGAGGCALAFVGLILFRFKGNRPGQVALVRVIRLDHCAWPVSPSAMPPRFAATANPPIQDPPCCGSQTRGPDRASVRRGGSWPRCAPQGGGCAPPGRGRAGGSSLPTHEPKRRNAGGSPACGRGQLSFARASRPRSWFMGREQVRKEQVAFHDCREGRRVGVPKFERRFMAPTRGLQAVETFHVSRPNKPACRALASPGTRPEGVWDGHPHREFLAAHAVRREFGTASRPRSIPCQWLSGPRFGGKVRTRPA